MISMKIIWLAIAIIFGILELFTLSLTMIWFSIGAICAIIVSFITDNIFVQIGVFILVSLILLYIATRSLIKMDRSNNKKWANVGTNIDAIIGKKGYVISEITPYSNGIVKVNSEEWSAKSGNVEETIPVGEEVVVDKIEGVKVIVSRI